MRLLPKILYIKEILKQNSLVCSEMTDQTYQKCTLLRCVSVCVCVCVYFFFFWQTLYLSEHQLLRNAINSAISHHIIYHTSSRVRISVCSRWAKVHNNIVISKLNICKWASRRAMQAPRHSSVWGMAFTLSLEV